MRLWRERLGDGRYKVWAEQIDRSFYGHSRFWAPGDRRLRRDQA